MDVKKHGNPEWLTQGLTEATQYEQAEHGKTNCLLFISLGQEGLNLSCSAAMSETNSLPDYRSGSFQGLPYINPMSLSDPSLTPLGTTAITPKQQAQAREMYMNSSMMYMHELRDRQVEQSGSPRVASLTATTGQQPSTSASAF
ncbi:Autophagy- protein 9A [Desmophyllum pertusum]|uniref:Autophagy- protein 9A n=1 Tax=Desmophyllum pertusum TaxID=174260 RepID=A0A9X0A1V9_9CNID|nr:Autophagy- protein 9A [Desmophyllum pertusum]